MSPADTTPPALVLRSLRFAPVAIALCWLFPISAHGETTSTTGAAYASLCTLRQVPLPPPFGGTTNAWTFSGELAQNQSFNDIGMSNIYYWNDPQGQGSCVADARTNGTGKTDFFGVLCQSIHGKVCLWDQASSASGNAAFTWSSNTGSSASIVSGAPSGKMRVSGLTGMTTDNVGRSLTVFGGKTQNSGAFLIATIVSSTTVDVVNGIASLPDSNPNHINWRIDKLAVPTSGTGPGGSVFITSTTQANIPTSGPRWSGGADLQSGGPNSGAGTCTDCHQGENIFINHPGSAVDLWSNYRPANVPSPLIPITSWYPDNWPDPIVPRSDMNGAWPQNVGPATFVDSFPRTSSGIYSASTSNPPCVSCHTPDGRGSVGGRLASLRSFGSFSGLYYSEIVNDAATHSAYVSTCSASDIASGDILCPAGGMPPTSGGAVAIRFLQECQPTRFNRQILHLERPLKCRVIGLELVHPRMRGARSTGTVTRIGQTRMEH